MLSRGQGARLALLTLTRGESGDNAIGPELFDGLGLIRTEELAIAGRYYGVDRQYFTSAVDYGYSKRLDEALAEVGPGARARRRRAGDPDRSAAGADLTLPGQPARRPRQPRGRRADHAGGVRGRRGSEDVPRADRRRSATLAAAQALHGRRPRERGLDDPRRHRDVRSRARRLLPERRAPGAVVPAFAEQRQRQRAARDHRSAYYKRLQSIVAAPAKETSFFDGIDTTIPGMYRALRKPAPAEAGALLAQIDRRSRKCRDRVHDERSVRGGAGARACAGGDAHRRGAARPMPMSSTCCA